MDADADARFAVGDPVEAYWEERWWPAKVKQVLKRSYDVEWVDDPDLSNVIEVKDVRAPEVRSDASSDADAGSSDAESEADLHPDRSRSLRGRDLETCACCRWRGKAKYGTSANGYRDGWCQPVDNFSRAVRRGDYGRHMSEPFCLEEHASQQTDYVNRVLRPKVTADDGGEASCDDDVSARDDGGSYLGTDEDGSDSVSDGDGAGASDASMRAHVHRRVVDAPCSRCEVIKVLNANGWQMTCPLCGGNSRSYRVWSAEQDDGDGGAEAQVPVAPQEEEQEEQEDGPTFTEAAPLGNMFAQNDEVKALGARWDAAARTWTAPVGAARADFEPWVLLSGFQQDLKVPYAQKDAAKQEVGAQWDGGNRKWFLPKHRLCAQNLDFCRGRG